MENWASWQPFQRISLSPAVRRSHMNAGSSAKKGGGLWAGGTSRPARMCGDLKRSGSKQCTGVIGREKKGEEEKWSVLTNDSFEMNTLWALREYSWILRGKEVLIILSWIPPGEHIISEPGLLWSHLYCDLKSEGRTFGLFFFFQ